MESLTKPGLYWVKAHHHWLFKNNGMEKVKKSNPEWELVEIRTELRGLVVYHMGWDCGEPISNYDEFITAKLYDPSGELYITP